jgi:hypothetical protein
MITYRGCCDVMNCIVAMIYGFHAVVFFGNIFFFCFASLVQLIYQGLPLEKPRMSETLFLSVLNTIYTRWLMDLLGIFFLPEDGRRYVTSQRLILLSVTVTRTLEHGASVKLFVLFQFLYLGQSVGLLVRVISSSQYLYLHRTKQT